MKRRILGWVTDANVTMVTTPSQCRSAQLQAISRLTGHHPFGGDRPPEPPPPWPPPPPPRGTFITTPIILVLSAITIIYLSSTRLPQPIRHVYSPFFYPRGHQLHHHQPYHTEKNNSVRKLIGFPSPCPLEGCWRPWSPTLQHFRARLGNPSPVTQTLGSMSSLTCHQSHLLHLTWGTHFSPPYHLSHPPPTYGELLHPLT